MLDPGDWREIAAAHAAIAVSFHHAGTSSGAAGVAERDEEARASAARGDSTTHLQRLTDGTVRTAVVYVRGAPQLGPVGGGSHIPVGDVTEIVGVGVLPAFRRQGLGGQLSYALAMDALTEGVATVFCSAQSDDVARVYEAVGFRRVGTACVASVEPAGTT
jgi:ribosomal protein S18 acetylase RimI-like enzyme